MDKQCKLCNEVKELEFFYVNNGKYHNWCKPCCIAWQKNYYREHRQQRLAYSKKYTQTKANPDKQREYHKAYRERNKDKIRAYFREYYSKNKTSPDFRKKYCTVCASRIGRDGKSVRALDKACQAQKGHEDNCQSAVK